MALALTAAVSASAENSPVSDDDICQAVFNTIQSSDAETFSSFLITKENLQGLAASLDESDPKEGSIRAEMSGEFSVDKMTEESLVSFKRILKDSKEAELDLTEATYGGIISLKTRYEAGNHKCKAIKFRMDLAGESYSIRVSVFQTKDSNFVYDALKANKLDIVVK